MSTIRVSDRALIGFLQRTGFDVESVRRQLELGFASAHASVASIGVADHLIVADGLTYVVRKGVVTNVVCKTSPRAQASMLSRLSAQG